MNHEEQKSAVMKAAMKEAMKEWLDEQFARFGRWAFFSCAAVAFTWFVKAVLAPYWLLHR